MGRFFYRIEAIVFAVAMITMTASGAGASGTMYDMSAFLNEPYPFAPAPVAAPPAAPAPITARPSPAAVPVVEDTAPADSGDGDPIEPVNRFFFGFNEIVQDYLLGPIANAYNDYLPDMVTEAIGNTLDNLNSPVVLANDILRGEVTRAWQTTERLAVNSTIGLGGLMDVADSWLDIPAHKEDFGQTLGAWGVGEGFYIVLPLLGPSNPRDGVGKLFVDGYFDPVGMWLNNTNRNELKWTRTGLSGIDEYAGVVNELDQIKKTSIDYYAAIRSMYRQKRQTEIDNKKSTDVMAAPDINYDLEE